MSRSIQTRARAVRVLGVGLFVGLALSATPMSPARADDDAGHGAYGRFDADLVLALDLGAGGRADGDAVLAGDVRARYLDSAGVFVGAERDLGTESAVHVVAGIDFRPVFLARFFTDLETGSAWLDLLIDSIGLDLGAAWARAGEEDDGIAIVVGGGIEAPIYVRRGRGVALRLGVRHIGARARWQRGPHGGIADTTFIAALVVRTSIESGIATRER